MNRAVIAKGAEGWQLVEGHQEAQVAQVGSNWRSQDRPGHSHTHTGTHRDPPTRGHTDARGFSAPRETLKGPDTVHMATAETCALAWLPPLAPSACRLPALPPAAIDWSSSPLLSQ